MSNSTRTSRNTSNDTFGGSVSKIWGLVGELAEAASVSARAVTTVARTVDTLALIGESNANSALVITDFTNEDLIIDARAERVKRLAKLQQTSADAEAAA